MAEIWLAGAAAFAALAALLCLMICALREQEINDTLKFLVNENDELKKHIEKTYEQTAHDINVIKMRIAEIEREIKK